MLELSQNLASVGVTLMLFKYLLICTQIHSSVTILRVGAWKRRAGGDSVYITCCKWGYSMFCKLCVVRACWVLAK